MAIITDSRQTCFSIINNKFVSSTYISFLVCIIKNDDISFWQTYPVIVMVENTHVRA